MAEPTKRARQPRKAAVPPPAPEPDIPPCDTDPDATPEDRQLEGLLRLRVPFDPEQIGKLPRASTKTGQKGNCGECGKYHVLPAVHLDYVGHAAVTDRLLKVDPFWSWEPFAVDPVAGLPVVSVDGNEASMWIRMTVCGVTRVGVGIVETSKNEREKQLISDAIRNAAMRFGVALDLWSKEDLSDHEPEQTEDADQRPAWERLGYKSANDCDFTLDVVRQLGSQLDAEQREAFRAWRNVHNIGWPIAAEHSDAVLDHLGVLVETPPAGDAASESSGSTTPG